MSLLRLVLLLVLAFMFLTVLRGLRIFLAAFLRRPGPGGERSRPPAAREAEMVRDPVCGTWVDRRLAVAGRRGDEFVPVCSEKCRASLEAQAGPEAGAR
ncbi:MAG TPA: hypothetical protein VGH97_08660 [Thermoanaerobaculia bacterium]|jgi:hypothetical protein